MSGDDRYSRRQLLQAIGVTGALGAAGGTATGAYLSDWEPFSGNIFGTANFSLELAADQADDVEGLQQFSDDDFRADGTINVGFPELEPGDTGVLRVAHRLDEGQRRLWMRSEAAGESDLGTYVEVDLVRRPACDGSETIPVYEGALDGLIEAYADGGLITDTCLDGRSCLDLNWELRDDIPSELSEQSLSCSLDFTAVQCRHNQKHDNPWNEMD